MASAAAVAADAARSPLGVEADQENGIVSAVTANDDDHTGLTDDDDDVTLPVKGRRSRPTQQLEEQEDGDEDLFGEDDDVPTRRHLDDEELDSGDEQDRDDRAPGDGEEEVEMVAQELVIQDVEIPRAPMPEPSDGEMYLMKVPKFFAIDPKSFTPDEFTPPTADHHSKEPSLSFSAYHTALSTIRWRRSPSDPTEIQSNARINRWSDGSLTLQFASNPTIQYEINANALAPPQRNPITPTPTSIHTKRDKGGRQGIDHASGRYDPSEHAYTYLAAPTPSTGLVRVSNVLTTGLTVAPPADFIDEAIVQLQTDLAAATRKPEREVLDPNEPLEDPELARKRAEVAEKQKAKAQKRQEAQMDREEGRTNRALGRRGLGSQRFGGLSAGMLEDDDGMTTTRGRSTTKPRTQRRRRANSEYSSEEDYGRRAFQVSKEDDYDKEDDFVAASDEEEEVFDDEEDEDEGIIEEGRARRETTPKRSRAAADEDDDEDAEGEVDDTPAGGAERKRRRVVDDDDDDE